MRNTVRYPGLLQLPLLQDLPQDFNVQFLDQCALRTFDRPTQVLRQSDGVPGMFIVAQGSVEITCINAEGQTVLIHLCRQGEVFGDVEVLADKPAAATCTVAARTTLLKCDRAALLSAMQTPLFMRNVMAASWERLVRDNAIKFVDQFYGVEQRLCDYLHRLSVDRPEISKTQADLAGLLGCARQTLNRELGRLRDRQIIAMEKGKIRVLDREALWQQRRARNGTAHGGGQGG